jgi:uncharacterized protein (TIGR03905 family)
MKYSYAPSGVCSSLIEFEIEDGRVKNVVFSGGCDGNSSGISRLVDGAPAEEIAEKLAGLRCGGKPTSCPDQLAKALRRALARPEG